MPTDQTTWRYIAGHYSTVLPQGGRWAYFIIDFEADRLQATAGVKEGGTPIKGTFIGQHGFVWKIE